MSGPRPPAPAYVCGHGPREMARLAVQDAVYGDVTALALAHAGIGPGLRVVDVGAGASDVSLRVAALVGSTGEVTGVDRSADAARRARARAAEAGQPQVRTVVAESLRSRPRAAGVAAPSDAEMDGLETALRDELVRQAGVIAAPPAVAAWTRAGEQVA